MSNRIGVLGSICNPPHLGHATLARSAAEQLGLSHVLLIPTGTPAHREAQAGFDEMGRICREAGAPWVLLSAGVTPAQFLRVMRYAYAAGAHGFLAGRAIWASALQRYPDLPACEEVLRTEGLQTLHSLVDLTQDAACAWTPDYSGFDHLRAEGDLCAAYA